MNATQTNETDAHGNYAHKGEFHRSGETFDSLVPRVIAHLERTFPEYGFSPDRKHYAGGRSLTVRVVSGPAGLSERAAADEFKSRMVREIGRFNNEQGNVLSDYHVGSFHGFAEIDQRYHAQHAKVDEETAVEATMTLGAFKKAVKAGDRITLVSTNNPYSQKLVGIERTISQARSGDFIVGEGKERSYFTYPKAGAFACDGERFRVSDASEHNPDAYRLYRWVRI